MAENKQFIVRRETTRSSMTATPVPRHLPNDVFCEQVDRLALFSLIGAVLWAAALLLDATHTLPMAYEFDHAKTRLIEVLGVLVSAAMFVYARYSGHSAQIKSDVSIAYMLLNAAAVAAMNTWVVPPPVQWQMMQVSWVAILVLVYAMVAPINPRKVLWASLAAASLDPLGVWFAHLRGVDVPSPVQTFVLFWPNYACACISTVPSKLLQRVGGKLSKARELGSYELVKLLGHGGMGEVWEAQHRLLARHAAVKLVRPEVLGAANDDEARVVLKRFEREAQATAGLSSPHTIGVFDFGITDQGVFYYVMELLMGRDLESLVRDFGPVPAPRAGYLLRQVCHSLADAHARGLVHRDIKPANIYICRMGLEYDFVKVLDFGLVKVGRHSSVHWADTQTLTTSEQKTTGTPAYMAPEVILGEGNVDRRADVYALGCVAYYLLTGQLVFEADTPMKMLLQHVQAEPIPPSQRTELPIPRELDELVMACLRKNPNDRPQNAEQLLKMACSCKTCDSWSSDLAKEWWERHLPEFTGPLSVSDVRGEPVTVS